MNKYKIYIHICPNNKKYVGMTINTEKRWRKGLGYKDNMELYNDILKYGWENITHKILAETEDDGIARFLERVFIKKYNTLEKDKGYNKVNKPNEKKSTRKEPLRPVAKYDLNGKYICVYNSVYEAGDKEEINPYSIKECCSGRISKSHNFIWKYIKV